MTAEAKRDAAEDAAVLDAVALGSPTTAARAEDVDCSRCVNVVCAEPAAASDAGAAGASAASPADEEEAARALAEHNALSSRSTTCAPSRARGVWFRPPGGRSWGWCPSI